MKQLRAEVEALQAAVAELQTELAALRQDQEAHVHPVETLIRQRGLRVLAHGDRSQVLLPASASAQHRALFYQLLRRYSFRLFLRDLLQIRQGNDPAELSRYCSPRTVRSYLHSLAETGIVHLGEDSTFSLANQQITSFGPTLEWYVSEILRREFLAPALFNVRLLDTRHGGDYDVIALVAERLAYVEVKSSPPRGVELPNVAAFLNRLEDLQPQLAVFLVDTELRMRDKIVVLFREALEARYGPHHQWPVKRLRNELFHIRHGIYLVNSQKGIYTNLRFCIRDFLKAEKRSRLPLKEATTNADNPETVSR